MCRVAAKASPYTETLPSGSVFYQSYRRWIGASTQLKAGQPLYMDSSNRSRFNSSIGSFGVTYLSESPGGAFLETLIRDPDQRGYSMADVDDRLLATIRCTKDLCLVKCYGNGLKRNQLTASIAGTDNGLYHASQAASEGWYQHSQADGVIYMSRLDNTIRCIALYDRAKPKVKVVVAINWAEFSGFYNMVDHYELSEID